MQTLEQRFWKYVDKRSDSECWPWMGYDRGKGYGGFVIGNRTYYAHRVSWPIAHKIEVHRLLTQNTVLHSCDNCSCVNPKHLRLGNNQQNMDDMKARGRSLTGEKHRSATLTWEQIKEIRKLRQNASSRQLALRFKVSQAQISRIWCGTRWKEES